MTTLNTTWPDTEELRREIMRQVVQAPGRANETVIAGRVCEGNAKPVVDLVAELRAATMIKRGPNLVPTTNGVTWWLQAALMKLISVHPDRRGPALVGVVLATVTGAAPSVNHALGMQQLYALVDAGDVTTTGKTSGTRYHPAPGRAPTPPKPRALPRLDVDPAKLITQLDRRRDDLAEQALAIGAHIHEIDQQLALLRWADEVLHGPAA